MKLLIPIFTPPTGAMGPHTRAVAVGSKAIEMDHEVAFCVSKTIGQHLTEQGFKVYTVPGPTFLGLPSFLSKPLERKMFKNNSLNTRA